MIFVDDAIVCMLRIVLSQRSALGASVLFTGDYIKQDLWYTQKPIHELFLQTVFGPINCDPP